MADQEAKIPQDEPEVASGREGDMREAWQNRPHSPRPEERIRPEPSLALDPALKPPQTPDGGQSAEPTSEDEPGEQRGRVAKALKARQKAERASRAEKYAAAGLGGKVEGKFKKFRQLKKIIRVIRAGGLVGTSLGDVFFSLSGLFLSLVVEALISKFVPGYELFPKDDPLVFLDKILWYVGWAVVISALVLLVVLLIVAFYISENPTNALRLLTS